MGDILSQISGPQDLKNLNDEQLVALASEIRAKIISTVSRTGGHLAPSLGVVELTIAMHRVLNSPRDRIIWDVGHQSYAHKLLTGRRDHFHTLRQPGGLSGFPKRTESPHDAFDTGHASTSVSAALGLAQARDLRGEDHRVVAVIGDGALTGGMAYEALNNAGHQGTDLTVILNDNSMSIAPNVGAMSVHLNRLRTEPVYSRLRDDINSLLKRIPRIGPSVSRTAERIKQGLKYVVLEGMLFEELGFKYLGPIDGHDMAALVGVLGRAKALRGPVLIHVVTTKGKGFRPAEDNPCAFHGTGPFDPQTGLVNGKAKSPSYSSVFGHALVRLARDDDRIVAITAAMLDGTGLRKFAEEFPDRCYDVGIAEQHAVTFAAGLAAGGQKPVVAIYSTFLQRSYDQVIHDVSLQNLPVIFALDRAGIVGEDGETHHGIFDMAYLRHLPRMMVMAPSDGDELRAMLKTAIHLDCPSAIRYPRGSAPEALSSDPADGPLELGRGRLLRDGGDVALVAIGSMVGTALSAAEMLAADGIEAAVLDARFVKPLPQDQILELADRCPLVVTLEEGVLAGGFGSAVGESIQVSMNVPVRLVSLGIPDQYISHGHTGAMLGDLGLDASGIYESVTAALRTTSRIRPTPAGRRR